MKVRLREVTVRELVADYRDDDEDGVFGYGGKLDIRPPFQREFIYGTKERNAVIDSMLKGFPLNVMYWSDRENDTFEVIDGQQRTISIAQYVEGDFSFNALYFHNLPNDVQERIYDYQLTVYVCTGTDGEKLDWFKTINIAGKELTAQELRNAVYSGSWVTNAKRYFSRRNGPAYQIGSDHLAGTAIRQEYLETAIKWISGGNIEDYMGRHQDADDASDLWRHFETVIDWVKATFVTRPRLMRGIDWGELYGEHHCRQLNYGSIEEETRELIADEEVRRQKGIYEYILTREERHLRLREFPDAMKQRAYEAQRGKCAICGREFSLAQMEADHITPWIEGGKTVQENCQMLCREDNRIKGAK